MVETYQSSKHDKMISLIAWLIVGSLLFYLAVYTFESFLRKSPYQEIIQQVGSQKSVDQNTEKGFISSGDLTFAAEQPVTPVVATTTTTIATAEPTPKAKATEPYTAAKPVATAVVDSASISESTAKASEGSVSPLKSDAIVRPSNATNHSSVVAVANSFSSMDEVFRFMKQVDYGEEEVWAEVVDDSDGFLLFFRSPATELSPSPRLEYYLKMRNHGLKISLQQAPEQSVRPASQSRLAGDQTSSRQTGGVKSGLEPSRKGFSSGDVQDNFKANAQFKPYTIQIGAFNSLDRADALLAKMLKNGYDSIFIEQKILSGEYNFRVLLGNFVSQQEAAVYATSLSEKENVPVFVRTF